MPSLEPPDDADVEPDPEPGKGPRRVTERLQTRLNGLTRLTDAASGYTVDQANEAYQAIYGAGPRPASILVRAGFVARTKSAAKAVTVDGDRDKMKRRKPPAADIVRSRGVAFRLELGLLFVRQCRSGPPGARVRMGVTASLGDAEAFSLTSLVATGPNPRSSTNYRRTRTGMRARQVENALDLLAQRNLVELVAADAERSRFDTIWLSDEAGPGVGRDRERYKPPGSNEPVISIPIEFFTHGWIHVLTDSEIWNWLAFRHRAEMSDPVKTTAADVRIEAWERLRTYDLTRDAWDTHLMLGRLGLMTANPGVITSDATTKGQRFTKEPHDFDLDDAPLRSPGHAAVSAAVAALYDDLLDGK